MIKKLLKNRRIKSMLDMSDRKETPPHAMAPPVKPGTAAYPVLMPGHLVRHYKGGLYRIKHLGTNEENLEPVVFYKAVDPLAAQDGWVRTISNFFSPIAGQAITRFSLIPEAPRDVVRWGVPSFIISDTLLGQVLDQQSSPWRFFHSAQRVYDSFAFAKNRKLTLTPEQALALLFQHIIFVPGVFEQNQQLSANVVSSLRDQAGHDEVDWSKVTLFIRELGTGSVTSPESQLVQDLSRSFLGADAIPFCASEELIWLENRHMLNQTDPRKDFDTRRLKYLLALAEKGPLFSEAFQDLEANARGNLEGLRQAWVQKYSA
jgi:hypothetical protein